MPSSEELEASMPSFEEEEEDEKWTFLGVPDDYFANRDTPAPLGGGRAFSTQEGFGIAGDPRRPTINRNIAPRYREGEQYTPMGGRPESIVQLQTALEAVGLRKKNESWRAGVWDETAANVYTRLLKFANRGGYTADEALQVLGTMSDEERDAAGLSGKGGKGGSGGSGGGGGGRAARAAQRTVLTHPDDLRSLADRVARKTLGHKLNEEQMQRFVSAYQRIEQEESNADYATGGEGGGTMTQAMSPETFAENQMEELDPVAFESKRQLDVFKTISGALGGMSSRGTA